MQPFRPSGNNILPPVIKNLLIINGLFFFAKLALGSNGIDLDDYLALHHWTSPKFMPHQVITHMFMHGSYMHIISNMFMLWMFGSMLERLWGPKRFLIFYFVTAFGASVLYEIVNSIEINNMQAAVEAFRQHPDVVNLQTALSKLKLIDNNATFLGDLRSKYGEGLIGAPEADSIYDSLHKLSLSRRDVPVEGASGAVFGVLTAFAMYFPNTELMLIFLPIPIKAKYFVALYALMELYLGVANNPADNVAHFAHLGGALFGFILVKYWNKNNRRTFY